MRNPSIREFLNISIFPCDPGEPPALNFNLSSPPHPESIRAGLTTDKSQAQTEFTRWRKAGTIQAQATSCSEPRSTKHPTKAAHAHF